MTTLLDSLDTEVHSLDDVGLLRLDGLLLETDTFLQELKDIEKALEKDAPVSTSSLDKTAAKWYKGSIDNLKGYNTQINKFSKNVLNNSQYRVSLDDAYPFPLNLDSLPLEGEGDKAHNHTELLKAIVLHLLKIGQCDVVKDIVGPLFANGDVVIEEPLLDKFKFLNEIVDDITQRHDLTKVLEWFRLKYNQNIDLSNSQIPPVTSSGSNYHEIEFKFHILQFVLLLNDDLVDTSLSAYLYSKDHFPRFFNDYIHEISPLMTLLLFQSEDDDPHLRNHDVDVYAEFRSRMKHTFEVYKERKKGSTSESRFVSEVLANFSNIHAHQSLFVNLSNEFISEYCKDLNLSKDSSLFQAVLAGFINLPNFHKYNTLQKRIGKRASISLENRPDFKALTLEAPYNFDLPFSLPDSNRFLFKYHPIFICPVSKEQLVPLTVEPTNDEHKHKKKKKDELVHNPVVVLEHCQHVALRDSIWQLLKRGTENFKCHYCYRKHKFSEVSDVYFIDL